MKNYAQHIYISASSSVQFIVIGSPRNTCHIVPVTLSLLSTWGDFEVTIMYFFKGSPIILQFLRNICIAGIFKVEIPLYRINTITLLHCYSKILVVRCNSIEIKRYYKSHELWTFKRMQLSGTNIKYLRTQIFTYDILLLYGEIHFFLIFNILKITLWKLNSHSCHFD